MRPTILLSLLYLLSATPAFQAADEANLKPDVKALQERFKIVKQRFDAGKRQYTMILEAKVTADEACHFDASFQDMDDKEVKAVKLEFEDGGKQTIKGEKYTASIKYPTRKTMEKVSQIIIKKSD